MSIFQEFSLFVFCLFVNYGILFIFFEAQIISIISKKLKILVVSIVQEFGILIFSLFVNCAIFFFKLNIISIYLI